MAAVEPYRDVLAGRLPKNVIGLLPPAPN